MKRYGEKGVFVYLVSRILSGKKLCKDIVHIIVIEFLGYGTFLSILKLVINDLEVEKSIMSTMMLFLKEFSYVCKPDTKVVLKSTELVNVFNKLNEESYVCRLTYPEIHKSVKFLTTTTSDLFVGTTDYNNKLDALRNHSLQNYPEYQNNLYWCGDFRKILSDMFKENGIITLPPYIRRRSMVKIIEDILNNYFGLSVSYIPRYRMYYSIVFMLSSEDKDKNLRFSNHRLYSVDSIKSIIKSNRTFNI